MRLIKRETRRSNQRDHERKRDLRVKSPCDEAHRSECPPRVRRHDTIAKTSQRTSNSNRGLTMRNTNRDRDALQVPTKPRSSARATRPCPARHTAAPGRRWHRGILGQTVWPLGLAPPQHTIPPRASSVGGAVGDWKWVVKRNARGVLGAARAGSVLNSSIAS